MDQRSSDHVDKNWQNNRIETDHAALRRLPDPGKGIRSLRTVKATLNGIEAVGMIKRCNVYDPSRGVMGEVRSAGSSHHSHTDEKARTMMSY